MLKFKQLTILFFLALALNSCKKDEDSDKQITNFIEKNNIPATKDASGLYYQIIKPGSGTFTYPANTSITIKYEGRLLDGSVFDNGGGKEQTFVLSQLIQGWRIGIPKIQKGGEIRLIIPPGLGYGSSATGPIPGNSVLDFTIQLSDAK
ncbi:FKBP-type peptidyl-prolyl cis-trans isomerase FkpA [Pedobacter psychrotolerans]|uniref:Peptidyl-prolyl cis-trans isomerase n=1 Tax=Pedobacter psychrotolerans TaxID=1843235 RepID=A0A4R2H9K2_9SPHI|nr:FKBP-type peptidyl-prolyl cis-trans isomerase [Pedobacter psychrotolerans]TCO23668.1 FKBP-type peptidyl-prolyl cis-trans isomerase FkpA [Pedobacter psychrotolerans]GGE61704.1 peptidyl-prolyl cis-trans isomerase [Pedobacter psychrotolerans]